MDSKTRLLEHNLALAEVTGIAEHVVGKESSSWGRWWEYASANPIKLRTALVGALLSLGAPPHPAFLTQDLTDIVLSMAPPRHRNGGRDWMLFKNEVDRQYRRQIGYNRDLNDWARTHGFVYTNRGHDPAQFRKLFAAFLDLHACKVKKGGGR